MTFTFPSIEPSYGLQKFSSPKTTEIQFGDGYISRINFGLNKNPKKYNLVFKNITLTDSNTIENFLDARADDAASFSFTPPQESSASQFVCKQWSKTIDFPNRATIKATFEEVFQP
tara:strand:- start:851 stop:1198 length:348 start_codon:yes stop_codon:yes gene_type:complete